MKFMFQTIIAEYGMAVKCQPRVMSIAMALFSCSSGNANTEMTLRIQWWIYASQVYIGFSFTDWRHSSPQPYFRNIIFFTSTLLQKFMMKDICSLWLFKFGILCIVASQINTHVWNCCACSALSVNTLVVVVLLPSLVFLTTNMRLLFMDWSKNPVIQGR